MDLDVLTFLQQDGDTCTFEVIGKTDGSIDSSQLIKLAETKLGAKMTTLYLTGAVTRRWEVYAPRHIENTSPRVPYPRIDHTRSNRYGKYLLLTERTGGTFRGIFVTERYQLNKKQRSLCLQFSLNKPKDSTTLEIYQGESQLLTEGIKLWDFIQPVTEWKQFQVEARATSPYSTDMFFYIVSEIR